jgi:HSP20 family protein
MMNRWDPFADIARLQDQLGRWSTGGREATTGAFAPPIDICEEKNAIVVRAELPGLKAEDVHVNVENDVLTIRGERKFERDENRETYHRIERSYGTFTRSFSLPKTVDGNQVEADLTDGILTVRIPKKTAPEPKRIDVRSGGGGKPVGRPS